VAGYDLATKGDCLDLFRQIDDTTGLENLMVIHLNDSLKGLIMIAVIVRGVRVQSVLLRKNQFKRRLK